MADDTMPLFGESVADIFLTISAMIVIIYIVFVVIAILCIWKDTGSYWFIKVSTAMCAFLMGITILILTMIQVQNASLFRDANMCRLLTNAKIAWISSLLLHATLYYIIRYISAVYPLRVDYLLNDEGKCGTMLLAWLLPVILVMLTFALSDDITSYPLKQCTISCLPTSVVYVFAYGFVIPCFAISMSLGTYQVWKCWKASRQINATDRPNTPTETSLPAQSKLKTCIKFAGTIGCYLLAVFSIIIVPLIPALLYLHFGNLSSERFSVVWTVTTFICPPGFVILSVLLNESQRNNFKKYVHKMRRRGGPT